MTFVSAPAPAQDYPVRPIRAITATSAGGTSDIFMRLIGDAFQIVCDEHQIHCARDGGALLLHEGHQLLINRIAQLIHFVV